MRKFVIFFLVITLAIVSFLMVGCASFFSGSYGNVKIYMKDSPVNLEEVDHVYVTFTDAYAHKIGGPFKKILQKETTLDLKELMNNPTLLTNIQLEEGKYTELVLTISGAEIVVNGETYSMEVPSQDLKIPCVFEVNGSKSANILLDFDGKNSIEVIKAGKSDKYILRPVIIVESISYE